MQLSYKLLRIVKWATVYRTISSYD